MQNHIKLGVVAGAMVVAALISSAMTAGSEMPGLVGVLAGWLGGGIGQVVAVGIAVAIVALPVVIANTRSHRQLLLIAVLSVFGILPVVGLVMWVMALMMAAGTHPSPEPVRPAILLPSADRPGRAEAGTVRVPVRI